MTLSRRLLAIICATAALGATTGVVPPALAAGNAVINDCQAHGQLTHPYTVGQLRHALSVMPASVKQYTSCSDVVQNALVSARKHHGQLPVSTGSGGSSFLPTPVIIILVVLILGAVTFGALAIRRRRAGPGETEDVSEPEAPAEGTRTRAMPSVPPPGGAGDTAETRAMPSVPPPGSAGDTAETRAMPAVPSEEGSDDAPARVDEPEDDKPEDERP
jgi:hypothetical protein